MCKEETKEDKQHLLKRVDHYEPVEYIEKSIGDITGRNYDYKQTMGNAK
jgi:hypothetical protein